MKALPGDAGALLTLPALARLQTSNVDRAIAIALDYVRLVVKPIPRLFAALQVEVAEGVGGRDVVTIETVHLNTRWNHSLKIIYVAPLSEFSSSLMCCSDYIPQMNIPQRHSLQQSTWCRMSLRTGILHQLRVAHKGRLVSVLQTTSPCLNVLTPTRPSCRSQHCAL